MAFEDPRNTSLTLSLFSQLEPPEKQYSQLDQLTNLSLALSSDASKVHAVFKSDMILNRQASSISVISSGSSSMKRTRGASWEEVRIKKVSQMKRNVSSMSHSEEGDDQDTEEEGGVRKKLRLSKRQALVLEDKFREHITLNPKQKQALAEQLNLSARQVEVWFQNRRARTKLKQTEVDCELLKKFCETLTDENRKLQRELQELKALKRAAPPYYKAQLPAATLSLCPSCERSAGDQPALRHHQPSSKPPFSIINSTKKQFYGPLNNHSSAACK